MGFTAAFYDATLWRAERRGMSDRRSQVISAAYGRTLEIGAGTGLNLGHYPDAVDELVITEPDDAMAARLPRRAAKAGPHVSVVSAPAEELPFDDDSFDTVVATLVFCTVADPERAAAEVSRVLKPGGQLLFIEHVRADSERLARWQDRLYGPWKAFGQGCRCNVETLDVLRGAVSVDHVDHGTWRSMPKIVQPLVYGRAEAPS
jgi:ubiquinone/menaquinone biosynthesis C-methylase UbiE